jgi:retron-type reverse transcriptase
MDASHYRIFSIPKKNGVREIAEPLPELKKEQQDILKWLAERGIRPSKYAHGFTKRKSIKTNADLHTGKAIVVRVDLEDFFPSISRTRVLYSLVKLGLDKETASYIAEKCTLDDYLPQGAPTSPFLANLVAKKLDYRLAGYINKNHHRYNGSYTRYADDLCFSSNYPKLNECIPAIFYIIKSEGFEVNNKKTRIMRINHRQTVTGVVVNEKPNIAREKRRLFRAELHNCKMQVINGGRLGEKTFSKLNGMVGFFIQICPYHGYKFKQDLKEIKRLISIQS